MFLHHNSRLHKTLQVALTPNAEVNILVLKMAREEYFVPEIYAAFDQSTRQSLKSIAAKFKARRLPLVLQYLSEYEKDFQSIIEIKDEEVLVEKDMNVEEFLQANGMVPILLKRGNAIEIIEESELLKTGDVIIALMQLTKEAA